VIRGARSNGKPNLLRSATPLSVLQFRQSDAITSAYEPGNSVPGPAPSCRLVALDSGTVTSGQVVTGSAAASPTLAELAACPNGEKPGPRGWRTCLPASGMTCGRGSPFAGKAPDSYMLLPFDSRATCRPE